MKQVKPSVLFALVLTVLIGYFEPANAAKNLLVPTPGGSTSYVALNTTTGVCPFWPNPITAPSILTAVSDEVIIGATLQQVGGGSTPVSVIAYDQPFPLSTIENNYYFVPGLWPVLTGTTLAIPAVAEGNYILTFKTQSGNVYTTKLTIN
jgi:hypothetical protein